LSNDVPKAQVAPGGRVGGDVPRGGTSSGLDGVTPHKRKVSNFLLDKSLQLRYMISVIAVSAVISGVLGYLIYRQEQVASSAVSVGIANTFGDAELQAFIGGNMRSGDSNVLITMISVGVGLAVVLAAFLLVMTHKVAGPLHKVSLTFDDMARGKLPKTGGPRRWDMLQDFHAAFRDMHDATRTRIASDCDAMDRAVAALTDAGVSGDDPSLAHLRSLAARRRASLG
jgi:hypothetical protein